MDDIISILKNTTIESLPNYILNDLDYICDCYVQGITDFDFAQVSENMCDQQQDIKVDKQIYALMYNVFRNKLLLKNVHAIDDVLIHTYLDYYIESIDNM
mgnify:CR=1 FL=1